MNRLLERQIRKYLPPDLAALESVQLFLHTIESSYQTFEKESIVSARAFEISEEEYRELNDKLQTELELKRLSIEKLKAAVGEIGIEGFAMKNDDLLEIVDLLNTQISKRKRFEIKLKASEEKYRNILANMNLGLLEVDNDDVIKFANQSFCDMSGYGLQEIMGRNATELFPQEESKAILSDKNNLRKSGVSDAYEVKVTNKKGDLKWWLISGAPRYDDSGKLMGSIGIHLDITDRKTLELELDKARLIAEQSVRMKEAFLANMSHEIRTPMNAIIGMGRQLGKTELQPEQKFFLHTINTAADHLLVVINDILDISKISAGKLELEQIGFQPKELLQHVGRVMQLRTEEKGLELQINLDVQIADVLIGDSHRINQILLNLISNAVKFTEKGGVAISAKLKETTVEGQLIEFNIKDTGIGMSEDFLTHIFDKFSQEELNTARNYGGTGLGMAITKELVELMRGQISISSKRGIGTEVSVMLPFKTGSPKDLPGIKKNLLNSRLLQGVRILLAEDNAMNRLVAITVLKQYGIKITIAKNGAEAVSLLESEQFDLILMDMQMPVMNGLEATRVIRNELKLSIPIVALTANAIKGESDQCLAAGMNAFVSKPFEENDLINAIASLLKLK
ncbi:MAG: ATP-binding protein [Bacteroidota bacterium]